MKRLCCNTSSFDSVLLQAQAKFTLKTKLKISSQNHSIAYTYHGDYLLKIVVLLVGGDLIDGCCFACIGMDQLPFDLAQIGTRMTTLIVQNWYLSYNYILTITLSGLRETMRDSELTIFMLDLIS